MSVNLFLIAITLSLIYGAASQCSEPGLSKRDECLKLLFESGDCQPGSVAPQLTIPSSSNQTLEYEKTFISVNLTRYNASRAPYTEIICLSKPNPYLFDLPKMFPLHCETNVTEIVAGVPVHWKTAGNDVTVRVFVKGNDSEYEGCGWKRVNITADFKMNVNISARQDKSTGDNLFRMGDISITINASITNTEEEPTTTTTSLQEEGSGMEPHPSVISEYHYTLFFDNNETKPIFYKTNQSSFELNHSFTREGNNSVFVEVIYVNRSLVNGSSVNESPYYGENYVKFEVYEPIKETNMKFTNKSGSNVSVEVTASGSVPIHVEWNVTSTANISTLQCKTGKIILNDTVQKGAAFNCTIDQPGSYQFIANFSNKVSNRTDMFTYTIKKPSNTKTVVTTSTTVVIVTLLIVVVVLAIVFVTGYISYHKLKNRSTETANFTFIELHNPSRLQRVKSGLASVKDRVSRRSSTRSKLGLVPAKDGEASDVESFYGSLAQYPDHDNL